MPAGMHTWDINRCCCCGGQESLDKPYFVQLPIFQGSGPPVGRLPIRGLVEARWFVLDELGPMPHEGCVGQRHCESGTGKWQGNVSPATFRVQAKPRKFSNGAQDTWSLLVVMSLATISQTWRGVSGPRIKCLMYQYGIGTIFLDCW
jgi:hypothetical protein